MRRWLLPDAIPAEPQSLFFSRWHLSAGKGGYAVPRQAKRDGGALFAVSVRRSLGEGGPVTNLVELYACRAAPRASKASDGGTSLIGAASR